MTDPVARMSAGMGLTAEPSGGAEEEEERVPPQSPSQPTVDNSAGPAQPSPQQNIEDAQARELELILEQSRASAEAEAKERQRQEEVEFERVLQLSQQAEHQKLSDAERLAQEERDLLEALQASAREERQQEEDLQTALRQSLLAHDDRRPVASGSGLSPSAKLDTNHQSNSISRPVSVHRSSSGSRSSPVVLPPLPSQPSSSSSPSPAASLYSLSPRSSVCSPALSRPVSRRVTSRPLPTLPIDQKSDSNSSSRPPPVSVRSSPQPASAPASHAHTNATTAEAATDGSAASPSPSPGRLLNPFEDVEALEAPATWPRPHEASGGLPYCPPSLSLHQAPEQLQQHDSRTPSRTPSLELQRVQSFMSVNDYASITDSLSTFDLESSNGHTTVPEDHHLQQQQQQQQQEQEQLVEGPEAQVWMEDLPEEDQVPGVKIGFPRLRPLTRGSVFPQVVQVSRSEPGLETFSIETRSFRSLITCLCWNADCAIISESDGASPRASTTPAKASIAFEFFEGTHAPCLRLSITLDNPELGPSPPAPTHHPDDHISFRSEVPGLVELPMTAYALAQELQLIQKSARLCCERGGGALYELGQEIEKLARQHGEKGPGSEDPDVQDSCNRFDRLRRRLGRKSVDGYHHHHNGHKHYSNPLHRHHHHHRRHSSASTTAGATGESVASNSSSSGGALSPKACKAQRKFAQLKAAAVSGTSVNKVSVSGRDEADQGATELRDEAFFVTPFHLPPRP